MKTKTVATTLAVLLLLLTAVVAIAAPEPVVARYVVSGGGERVSDGATLVLYSVIGEPVATNLIVTGGYGHAAGFLPGLHTGDYLYMPLVQR